MFLLFLVLAFAIEVVLFIASPDLVLATCTGFAGGVLFASVVNALEELRA